ncbi:hypothetical protein ACN47E_006292 [Coniothyrium glycines]
MSGNKENEPDSTAKNDIKDAFWWKKESLDEKIWIRNAHCSTQTSMGAHASFGDRAGTTATVNKYGNIIQISRYLGFGLSGFFCVHQNLIYEPWYVQDRMKRLMQASEDPMSGLKIESGNLKPSEPSPPILGYMFDRWPRYVQQCTSLPSQVTQSPTSGPDDKQAASNNAFKSSIQYYCTEGTIFQQYLIHLSEVQDFSLDNLKISDCLSIVNLDFTENTSYDYNISPENEGNIESRASSDSVTADATGDNAEGTQKAEELPIADNRSTVEQPITVDDSVGGDVAGDKTDAAEDDTKDTPRSNSMGADHVTVDEPQSTERFSFMSSRKLSEAERTGSHGMKSEDKPNRIALIIQLFANNKIQCISNKGEIRLSDSTKEIARKQGCIELTMTYRLRLLKETDSRKSPKDVMPPLDHTKIPPELSSMHETFSCENPYKKLQFSAEGQLDYITRRNLEHVISVCSIPVGTTPEAGHTIQNAQKTQTDSRDSEADVYKVAITCGDISGHRVGQRASLSAIQFLVNILQFIGRQYCRDADTHWKHEFREWEESTTSKKTTSEKQKAYALEVSQDIRNILKGHFNWICVAEAKDHGAFAAHYWPSGGAIFDMSYLAPRSLLDTPTQILKLYWMNRSVFQIEDDNVGFNFDFPEHLATPLTSKLQRWLEDLHSSNKRGSYAFLVESEAQDADESGGTKFRLTDHVMICLAVEFAQSFLNHTRESMKDDKGIGKSIRSYYVYKNVREKVLKRFTVLSSISKQKMLATSRTPDETRTLLHSKDTFLFHATKIGFFREQPQREEKGNKRSKHRSEDDRWTNTLDHQKYFHEYKNWDWTKPLWYSLVFILSCESKRVSSSPVEDLIRRATNIFFACAGSNGLCPGLLDANQKPAVFQQEEDRDSYWHNTFEAPLVLWCYGRDNEALIARTKTPLEPSKPLQKMPELQDLGKLGHLTKKTESFTRFSSSVDQKRLVEIMDDWLEAGSLAPIFAEKQAVTDDKPSDTSSGIAAAVENAPRETLDEEAVNMNLQPKPQGTVSFKGSVIDVPRGSTGLEIFGPEQSKSDVSQCILAQRSLWKSKKRIVWLPSIDKEFLRKLAIFPDLAAFLRRHVSSVIYFHDEAIPSRNTWKTEFQVSFYRVVHSPRVKFDESLISESDLLQARSSESDLIEIRSSDPEKNSSFLSRNTLSFMFDGDFCDRAWTCYYLGSREHMIADDDDVSVNTLGARLELLKGSSEYQASKDPKQLGGTKDEREKRGYKRSWQQRKVFELYVVFDILTHLSKDTETAVKWIQEFFQNETLGKAYQENNGGAGIRDRLQIYQSRSLRSPLSAALHLELDFLKKVSSDNYSDIINEWRLFEQMIVTIVYNLDENLKKIQQWNCREQDRKSHQPRWTRRDERSHHQEIARATEKIQQKIREIERLKAQTEQFQLSVSKRLESIREDISFRGSQNINVFTYVTVVFLPLGFATGVYSTSGPPSGSTLAPLSIVAAVALSLTVFALSNARDGKSVLRPIITTCRLGCTEILIPLYDKLLRPILKRIEEELLDPIFGKAVGLIVRGVIVTTLRKTITPILQLLLPIPFQLCKWFLHSIAYTWKALTMLLFHTCVTPSMRRVWRLKKKNSLLSDVKAGSSQDLPIGSQNATTRDPGQGVKRTSTENVMIRTSQDNSPRHSHNRKSSSSQDQEIETRTEAQVGPSEEDQNKRPSQEIEVGPIREDESRLAKEVNEQAKTENSETVHATPERKKWNWPTSLGEWKSLHELIINFSIAKAAEDEWKKLNGAPETEIGSKV